MIGIQYYLTRGTATFLAPLIIVVLAAVLPDVSFAAEPSLPLKAQWARNMGQSGLRRLYATGGELGELINRQVSYQTARRIQLSAANPALDLPRTDRSKVTGYVGQVDSLVPLAVDNERLVFLRALGRIARRYEHDKIHSENIRYDVGLLYAPAADRYASVGLAYEDTGVDLKYINGESNLSGLGPRLDAGMVLRPGIAISLRAETMDFDGTSRVSVPTPGGLLNLNSNIDYQRHFFHLESLFRKQNTSLAFLPPGAQLGATLGFQYIENHYESQVNNLGQPVNEPFGNHQRLGIIRTGIYASDSFGAGNAWSMSADLLYDHEVISNMDTPIGQPGSWLPRVAIARVFGPGKRLTLEYQRSQNLGLSRERNNVVLTAVVDF